MANRSRTVEGEAVNHWLRGSTRRTYRLGLCVIWLTAAVSETWAKEPDLRAGEAFVIIRVTGDVRAISFQQFQGTGSFVAKRNSNGVVLRVKPGRYYLKSVTPVHSGITLPSNPEPSEPSRTVAVREGMVNYIGDWKFTEEPTDINYDVRLTMDLYTVKPLIKQQELSKYSLLVSQLGELPVKTAMPAD
jgi:hypothetical protein